MKDAMERMRKAYICGTEGFKFGVNGHVVSATPEGYADYQTVRRAVRELGKKELSELVKSDLADACIQAGLGKPRPCGLSDDGKSLCFQLDLPYQSLVGLPLGEVLPSPIRGTPLVGRTIADAEVLLEKIGACVPGSADFFREFGIEFQESGDGEACDCCGAVYDAQEDSSIGWVDSFALTQPMIDHIKEAGYLPELESALGSAEAAWGEVDWDTVPRLSGEAEFDASKWEFVPNYSAMLSGVDVDTVIAIMPRLVALVSGYLADGFLPPVPGALVSRVMPDVEWNWDPDTGECSQFFGGLVRSMDGSLIFADRRIYPIVSGMLRLTEVDLPVEDRPTFAMGKAQLR